MEALVLAGGRSDFLPVPYKADLIIGERTMVEHVVAALEEVPSLQKISVARGAGDNLVDNLLQAVTQLTIAPDELVLISACDIPFLTAAAINDFLLRCEPGYDVYYPIVRREQCEARFPGVKRTYARLREGTFTGGNLFVVRAGLLLPLAERLQRMIAHRKSPLKLSRELGLSFTLRFLLSSAFGTLSVLQLERQAERLLGVRPKAVVSDYAEIGTDIDKLGDLALLATLVKI